MRKSAITLFDQMAMQVVDILYVYFFPFWRKGGWEDGRVIHIQCV